MKSASKNVVCSISKEKLSLTSGGNLVEKMKTTQNIVV